MDSGGDCGLWSELAPDALEIIFDHLSFKEKLTVIPLVCKSWRIVLTGSYCWQELDIEEWSRTRLPHRADGLVQMLIKWSGPVSKLCVSGLHSDVTFSLIAQNAGSLQMLRLQSSGLTDSMTEHLAQNLRMVSTLDLSYCHKVSAGAIRKIGRNCKSLVKFCRNVNPLNRRSRRFMQDKEAEAISATMPKLKHLEMAHSSLRTRTVIKILTNCSHLEFFDLRSSGDIHLEKDRVRQMYPNLSIRGPLLSSVAGIYYWD